MAKVTIEDGFGNDEEAFLITFARNLSKETPYYAREIGKAVYAGLQALDARKNAELEHLREQVRLYREQSG